jgi:cytochrome c oxidase subunit 3/cytochrome o ubiquinol oxidase subunit 3
VSAAAAASVGSDRAWTRGQVGMLLLILGESSFFCVFLVAYLFYIGKSLSPPYPADLLQLPAFATLCLVSSSGTILLSVRGLAGGRRGAFLGALLATIALGGAFLCSTALEWRSLIFEHGLTISTNLFGTTYYSLVGFHAAHVAVGLLLMSLVFALGLRGHVHGEHAERLELLSWYWHFVDAVWLAVLTVVYVVGV